MTLCCHCCIAPSPILSCSLMGFPDLAPPGPVSRGALCTPRVLANAVNKAVFSVLAGVRFCCIEWGRELGGPRPTPDSGLSETLSVPWVSQGTCCYPLSCRNDGQGLCLKAEFFSLLTVVAPWNSERMRDIPKATPLVRVEVLHHEAGLLVHEPPAWDGGKVAEEAWASVPMSGKNFAQVCFHYFRSTNTTPGSGKWGM